MPRSRPRVPIFTLTLVLVAGLLLVPPAVAGHGLASLSGSAFEIDTDANLKVDHGGSWDDWISVTEARRADTPSGKDDDSYTGGAKEDDLCPSTSTGSIPPNKSDLLHFGLYEEDGDPGFLHLFWHRVQEPSGTTLMDFELNQSSTGCGNGANVTRTAGDLLIEYRIDQGGSQAAIFVREWTGSQWGAAVEASASGDATGTINHTAIPASEADGLGAISPRTFGEASIDLDLIFDPTVCTSFGSASLKSRSSTSFTSALKDFIAPVPINLSNCGQIDILKTDDAVPASVLSGATFTLYHDAAPKSVTAGGAQTEPGIEDTAVSPAKTCTSGASGTCTIGNVLAGDYWVVETTTPANHDTAPPQAVVMTADATVSLTFVNARQRGSILVHKIVQGGTPLAGAGFTITPGSIVMTETNTGVFCADGLVFGQYTVTESTTPSGYQTAPAQNFTVSAGSDCATRSTTPDVTFTNNPAPGTINVQKNDDDGNPLAGASFTVFDDVGTVGTYEPLVDTTIAAGPTAVNSAGQVSFTNLPAPADYCVVETTTPSGYDTAAAQCVNLPLGSSANTGATVTLTFVDTQQHRVIVIVCHSGTDTFAPASTGSSDALLTSSELQSGDPTQAELCALAGDEPRAHGDSVTVTVGNHP